MKQQNILKLKQKLKEARTKFIDLKYASLTGAVHHITVPFDHFRVIVNEGVVVDDSSLPGYTIVGKGDMPLFPGITRLFFDPFFEQKIVSFLCNIYSPDTLKPFQRHTRRIAKMAARYLKHEFNTESYFQAELEFYTFDDCHFGEGPRYNYFRIATEENREQPPYHVRRKGGYHIVPPFS